MKDSIHIWLKPTDYRLLWTHVVNNILSNKLTWVRERSNVGGRELEIWNKRSTD